MMAIHVDRTLEPDDPDLLSWGLAIGLWAECIVAVVAAMMINDSVVKTVIFALYALLLAVAAVARSGPLQWMRPATRVALVAVAVMHLAAWIWALGRVSRSPLELMVYGVGLAILAFATYRERSMPRDHALAGGPRILEVASRSVGLAFLAGIFLMIVDVVLPLPFSGH